MKINKEQALEMLDDEETLLFEEFAGKHDCTNCVYVFKKDNKYYKTTLSFSYNDGLQLWGEVPCVEVKPVEKVITDWVPVE